MESELRDNNAVRVTNDENVIFVGEKHRGRGSKYSRQLARRVLDAVEPPTVAIEAPAGRRYPTSRGSGMGVGATYAKRNRIPALLIDKNVVEHLSPLDVGTFRLMDESNTFPEPVNADGSVPEGTIAKARYNVAEQFGLSAYRKMYTSRETYMTEHLTTAVDEYETPIVTFCGVFHVNALKRCYDRGTVPTRSKYPRGRVVCR